MPELPDVEVFRRRVQRSVLARGIAHVEVPDAAMLDGTTPQALGQRLTGNRLTGAHRHGKHLLLRVSGDRGWLVLHFGMTGNLAIVEPGREPGPHVRFSLHLGGSRLDLVDQRRLGSVALADTVESYVTAHGLGEDALSLPPAPLRHLLRDRRGTLKSALMDQSLVAGLGNIYSDEVLFQARLAPRLPAASLSVNDHHRLYRRLHRVAGMAADRGADPERLPDGWLLRHREDGAPCPRGRGTVRRFRMGGRHGFYCPECQPDQDPDDH